MVTTSRSRLDVAEEIVIGAFVFVRQARAAGHSNLVTRLLLEEIAEERGLRGDVDYSLRTAMRLARERAALVGETHLIDFETREWK